jgi:60S ribosome subunit biogenesis protein NIP7
MRPLDEKETQMVFEKIYKFTGPNIKHLMERPAVEGPDAEPGSYLLRLHKNRVYYASEALVRRATSIARPRLAAVGTPIGKFTHHGSFHLTVHALDLLAAHARRRVWLKPDTERSFLFGNSVPKSSLARITENAKSGDGVVLMSMSDVPLGFGIAARSAQDCRKADTNAVVVHHQADAGEYLRKEDELM